VALSRLGRVDEFDQAESCGEGYDRLEVACCLFASEGDALEALDPADALLDASPCLVEGSREEGWLVCSLALPDSTGESQNVTYRNFVHTA